MQHRTATFGNEVVDGQAVARAIGLQAFDLLNGAPVRVGSTRVPLLFVPLKDPATVDRAAVDFTTLSAIGHDDIPNQVFVFAPFGKEDPDKVYSRMFGAGLGTSEDPATGGASGPHGAWSCTESCRLPGRSAF